MKSIIGSLLSVWFYYETNRKKRRPFLAFCLFLCTYPYSLLGIFIYLPSFFENNLPNWEYNLAFLPKLPIIIPKGNMYITTESELGVIIRERRKKQGLTIAELSMMVPCSPRLLSELERGKRGVSVGIILQLLALLGLTLDIKGREEIE